MCKECFIYYVHVSSQEQLVDARDVKDLEGINIVGRKLSDTAIIKGNVCTDLYIDYVRTCTAHKVLSLGRQLEKKPAFPLVCIVLRCILWMSLSPQVR